MYLILLCLIYLAFISLGLPDALLGAAWPSMYPVLKVPFSYAGIISMIIAGGTIISSLHTSKLISKFGTGVITAFSVMLTAVSLFGFSISKDFWILCLLAIPFGLGAGAVDAALNNFVALYYSSRHMSWLHCFWGVGASIGPYIMGYAISKQQGWETGYFIVFVLQGVLTAVLFLSIPIWKIQSRSKNERQEIIHSTLSLKEALKIRGVKEVLIAFFSYCALETTAGLWASSYLVLSKGFDVKVAAKWASLFYLGITFGRFVNGFIADKFGNKKMINVGLIIITIGLVALLVDDKITLIGLILIGIGSAPIYPCIIHETPKNFGENNSQAIIGIQMASAYTGSTFMPPLFGFIANNLSLSIYPFFLMIFLILMFLMTKKLNRMVKN